MKTSGDVSKFTNLAKRFASEKLKDFYGDVFSKLVNFFHIIFQISPFVNHDVTLFFWKTTHCALWKRSIFLFFPFASEKDLEITFFPKFKQEQVILDFMTSRKSKSSNIPCITQPFTSFRPCLHFYLGKSINNQRLYVFWQYLIELWMYEEAFTLSLTASINAEAVFRVDMLLFFDALSRTKIVWLHEWNEEKTALIKIVWLHFWSWRKRFWSCWWWFSFNLRLFSNVTPILIISSNYRGQL